MYWDLLIFAPPCGGKGDTANELKRLASGGGEVAVHVLPMSGVLRDYAISHPEAAQTIHEYMYVRKELVPDEVSWPAFLEGYNKIESLQGDLYLDGVPRNAAQVRAILSVGSRRKIAYFINTPETECRVRAAKRARHDDSDFERRWKEWDTVTLPAMQLLRESGISIIEVPWHKSPAERAEFIIERQGDLHAVTVG